MSFAIKIQTSGNAPAVLRAIERSVQPAALNPIVGRAAVNVFRSHLFACDRAKPNALGGLRTHFYAAAARGTHFTIVPDGVLLSVNQTGFRQRVVGGTIRKKEKWLTIPARPEAHGKRASEFGALEVVFDRRGRPIALALKAGTTYTAVAGGRRRGLRVTGGTPKKFGEILFWLKPSVTQRPDPTVVPTPFDLYAAIRSNVNDFLARQTARARERAPSP